MQPITAAAESAIRATFGETPGDPDECIAFSVVTEDGEYDCLVWLLESGDLEFDCFDNGKRGRLARWGSFVSSPIVSAEPIW